MKTSPKAPKNTPLARRLVKILERDCGVKWPNGEANSYIERTGYSAEQREAGACSAHLKTLDGAFVSDVLVFGRASDCTKAAQKRGTIHFEIF